MSMSQYPDMDERADDIAANVRWYHWPALLFVVCLVIPTFTVSCWVARWGQNKGKESIDK